MERTLIVRLNIVETYGVKMFLARFLINLTGLVLGCSTDIEWPIQPDVVDNEEIT